MPTPTRVSRVLLDLQLVHDKCPTNLKHNILKEKNLFFFSRQGAGGSRRLQKGPGGLTATAGCSAFPPSHLLSPLGGIGGRGFPACDGIPDSKAKIEEERKVHE